MKKIFLFIGVFILIFLVNACDDTPSEVGISVIPVTDEINYKTLETDSIPYTTEIIQKTVIKSGQEYLLVGKSGNEEAITLLKFTGFPDTLASATVIKADLVLHPTNYSLGEESTFGFTIHKITSTWSVTSPGNAMVTGPLYDNASVGTYSGAFSDTSAIYVPINTSLVKDWLYYASDATKYNLNQGIVLTPSVNSNCVWAFYSSDNTTYSDNSKDPYLRVIKELNGKRDTIYVYPSEDTYYGYSRNFSLDQKNIVMQSGISYRTKIKLDLSRIPKHVHITSAILTLTLDPDDSKIGKNSIDSLAALANIYNSDGVLLQSFNVIGTPIIDNGKKVYNFNITLFVQGWIDKWINSGMEIFHLGELYSLDRYSFYSKNVVDPNKKPKIKITYLNLPY